MTARIINALSLVFIAYPIRAVFILAILAYFAAMCVAQPFVRFWTVVTDK